MRCQEAEIPGGAAALGLKVPSPDTFPRFVVAVGAQSLGLWSHEEHSP